MAHTDALVRVRLFSEQNFNYIESIGLLGVTRYLFELVVWLKLMQQDERYGLVYYHELLEKRRRHYTDLRDHLAREVVLLKTLGDQEQKLMNERLAQVQRLADPAAVTEAMRRAVADIAGCIDGMAARAFTIYGDPARTNGYGFQAFLVETKILPEILESLAVIEAGLRELKQRLPTEVHSLIPKKWNWRDLAVKVGMDDEYDFIYTYGSRLLHATPASLTTHQKNLQHDEVWVFLKYCHVLLLDVIDMATRRLRAVGPARGGQ